jgi:hypothetical protein
LRYEWLNNGEPLPATHRKAGQVGLLIDFEDGRPDPQYVYAPDKDAMLGKLATMYSNAQVRIAEVKGKGASSPAQPTPAPASSTQAATPAGMTPEERIQTVADLSDPAKAPDAVNRLVAEATGRDLKAEKVAEDAAKAKEAEIARLQGETQTFLAEHPDYYGSKRNAMLLRDRSLSIAQRNLVDASHFAQAYEELQEMGVLETAPAQQSEQEDQAATTPPEPTNPPAARPRASTGMRPSAFRGAGRLPTGPQLTRAEVEAMAGTDEYAYRLKHEAGFAAKVEAALAHG